jgi:hypothetical protein
MSWRATTTVTVLRGTGTDRYDDPIDIDTVVYERKPASIIEQEPNSRSRPVDGRTDQVRGYTLRIHPSVELQRGDRIRDESDQATYTVDFIKTPNNPAGHRSRRVTLRKVT